VPFSLLLFYISSVILFVAYCNFNAAPRVQSIVGAFFITFALEVSTIALVNQLAVDTFCPLWPLHAPTIALVINLMLMHFASCGRCMHQLLHLSSI
jgi:hypothetical protein